MTTSDALQTCEPHEADLSAILDGELATVDLTRTLDHLVDCPTCAAFYRRSRELDHAVTDSRAEDETGERDAAIEPSADVWRRIAEQAPWIGGESAHAADTVPSAHNVVPLTRRRTRLMEWAPRLAAVLVLGFGLWMAHLVTRDPGSAKFFQHSEASADVLSEDDVSEAEVGSGLEGAGEPREMNEERFVQLATEVLQADARFHFEMLEVMKTVTRAEAREGTVDYRRPEENPDVSGSRGDSRREDRAPDGKLWR